MIDFHLSSERQEWCIMELLSFGLYLFSLVFLLFPFLLSCLSCDSFCWLPFRLRFFLLIPVVFSYLVFPPAAFTFCHVSAFRLQVFFSSGGFVFPSSAATAPAPAACAAIVASSSTFVASTSHSTVLILAHPGTFFFTFCHCCCH